MKEQMDVKKTIITCHCGAVLGCRASDGILKICEIDCGERTTANKECYYNCTLERDLIADGDVVGLLEKSSEFMCRMCEELQDVEDIPVEEQGPIASLSS